MFHIILTSLKVSPCVLLMYLRKAAVHWRVVTLSVSESQNGTSIFSSSQYARILLLKKENTNAYNQCLSNFTVL